MHFDVLGPPSRRILVNRSRVCYTRSFPTGRKPDEALVVCYLVLARALPLRRLQVVFVRITWVYLTTLPRYLCFILTEPNTGPELLELVMNVRVNYF